MDILEGEGIEVAQARSLVRSALKARKGKHGGKKAGGQGDHTDEITLAEDLCDNTAPACDSNSNFRLSRNRFAFFMCDNFRVKIFAI